MSFKVLIADDEHDLAVVVAFGVRMTWPGCEVIIAKTGGEALERFDADQPNLVILDVEMPAPDGLEVCRRIREQSNVPIMMLTVRDDTIDKVRALDLGADDYMTKPFEHSELLARLRALVRRSHHAAPLAEHVYVAGEFVLDYVHQQVRLRDELVPLTSLEYRLLQELVRHAGTVLSHRYLLERVWGPEYVTETHYLKVFVQRLRQKLGDSSDSPKYIKTEWGIGYQFLPLR
jgi:two-component system, OmpR family, KDP operon response regulator KdpE